MTEQQVRDPGPAFATYLRGYERYFDPRSAAHLRDYCRGLLSDLPRKSVEPVALAAGAVVRSPQEFIKDFVWDHSEVLGELRRRVVRHTAGVRDPLGTVGVVTVHPTRKRVPRRSPAASSRRSSTPSCSCPSRGTKTASGARRPMSPTRSPTGRSGRSRSTGYPRPRVGCGGRRPRGSRSTGSPSIRPTEWVPRVRRQARLRGRPGGRRLCVRQRGAVDAQHRTRRGARHGRVAAGVHGGAVAGVPGAVGLMRYEGRSYTGMMRHMALCLVTGASRRPTRTACGGENPAVTAEQVHRALNVRIGQTIRRERGTGGPRGDGHPLPPEAQRRSERVERACVPHAQTLINLVECQERAGTRPQSVTGEHLRPLWRSACGDACSDGRDHGGHRPDRLRPEACH